MPNLRQDEVDEMTDKEELEIEKEKLNNLVRNQIACNAEFEKLRRESEKKIIKLEIMLKSNLRNFIKEVK